MKNYKIAESIFYCTRCGRRGLPIARQSGREREAGHLKVLYCIYCKDTVNHAECKPFSHYDTDDFMFEFQNGNFTKNGKRKMPYGEFRAKKHNEGVELP